MKKITFFKTVMLAAFVFCTNIMYGQTGTITITLESVGGSAVIGSNSYGGTGDSDRPERTWVQNGVTFGAKCITANPTNSPTGAAGNTLIQAQASNGVIYNTTALPGKIVSITLNQAGTPRTSSLKCGVTRLVTADEGDFNVAGTSIGTANTDGWTSTDFAGTEFKFFAIKRGANAAYFSSIVIEYEIENS